MTIPMEFLKLKGEARGSSARTKNYKCEVLMIVEEMIFRKSQSIGIYYQVVIHTDNVIWTEEIVLMDLGKRAHI